MRGEPGGAGSWQFAVGSRQFWGLKPADYELKASGDFDFNESAVWSFPAYAAGAWPPQLGGETANPDNHHFFSSVPQRGIRPSV